MSVLPVGCLCGTPHGALRLVCFLWLIPANSYPHHEQETYNRNSLLRKAKHSATVRAGTCLQLKNANDQDQQVLFTSYTHTKKAQVFLLFCFVCIERFYLIRIQKCKWAVRTCLYLYEERWLVTGVNFYFWLFFCCFLFVLSSSNF